MDIILRDNFCELIKQTLSVAQSLIVLAHRETSYQVLQFECCQSLAAFSEDTLSRNRFELRGQNASLQAGRELCLSYCVGPETFGFH